MDQKNLNLLLIEDSPSDAYLLQSSLASISDLRFELTHVEYLSQGLRYLTEKLFDLVILDISLPDNHGLAGLVKIDHAFPSIPVIVLTGAYSETLAVEAVQKGAQDYMIKAQLSSDVLARAIRYAIERQRWRVELQTQMEALLRSETRLHNIIEHNADGIVIVDQHGQVCFVNPAAEQLFGYKANKLLGKPFGFPMVSGDKAELDILRAGNEHVIAEMRVVEIDWEGASAFLASLRDITERHRAEAEIQRRNRELSLLNQVIAVSAIETEPEAILETACRELAQAFDAPRAHAALFNEDKTASLLSVEYRAEGQPTAGTAIHNLHDALLRLALQPEGPLLVDQTQSDPHLVPLQNLLRQAGMSSLLILPLRVKEEIIGSLTLETVGPYSFTAAEVNLAWSVAAQVAGALARARLTQTQQRLSTAIEQANDTVIIVDTAGIIVYVNPAFERNSGYSRAEAIGQTPEILKSYQQDHAFYQGLWATISTGQVWRGRIVNQKKDGTLYTEDVTITPVRNETGAIVNYVSVQHDITRELQLEKQYLQAQKMEAIGRLSGGVAHDFNNLLSVINGYSEMLLMDRYQDKQQSRLFFSEEIRLAGERAASLTRQLLAFSRQQVLQPRILDLNEVVFNLEKMLRRLIGEDIDLVVVPGTNLGPVKADPGQVDQVILNLAVNARDAMPNGGKLTIGTNNVELDEGYARQHLDIIPGRYMLLTVSDSGTGMDAEIQSHIFEPFFTTKEIGKGTGLGLATVYGIVKQSGGDISVYSEPGQGATFKIYFPQVDEAVAAFEPHAPSPEMSTGTETVLVVEDEESVRELACQVLELSGYTVIEADCGLEALRRCQEEPSRPIHLLVTDVIMPGGLNGYELAEQLKELRSDLRVLFISGYTDDAIAHSGVLEAGVFFLQKPFSPYVLVQKVREVLDAS